MAEYIEHEPKCGDCYFADFCEQIPSVQAFNRDYTAYCQAFKNKTDVVEVVHASWVWGKVCGSEGYCCTNCGAGFVGENAEWIAKEHDYCPKCGAKMDGERRLKNENS